MRVKKTRFFKSFVEKLAPEALARFKSGPGGLCAQRRIAGKFAKKRKHPAYAERRGNVVYVFFDELSDLLRHSNVFFFRQRIQLRGSEFANEGKKKSFWTWILSTKCALARTFSRRIGDALTLF